MEYDVDTAVSLPILVDLDNSALEFNTGNQITGINVVDNFLFWTDGENEPKKINIENFRINGHTDLTTNSDMFVSGTSVGNVKKEHITVIKKRPTQAPTMDLISVGDGASTGVTQPISISGYAIGSNITILVALDSAVSYTHLTLPTKRIV